MKLLLAFKNPGQKIAIYNLRSLTPIAWALIIVFLIQCYYQPISTDAAAYLTIGKYLKSGLLPYRDFYDHKPYLIYLVAWLVEGKWQNYLLPLYNFLTWTAVSLLTVKIAQDYHIKEKVVVFIFCLIGGLIFEASSLNSETAMVLCLLGAWHLLLKKTNVLSFPYQLAGAFLLCGALYLKQSALISVAVIIWLVWKTKSNFFYRLALAFMIFIGIYFLPVLLAGLWKEFFQSVYIDTFFHYPPTGLTKNLSQLATNFTKAAPFVLGAILSYKITSIRPLYLMIIPTTLALYRYYPHYYLQVVPFAAIVSGHFFSNWQWGKATTAIYSLIVLSIVLIYSLSFYRPRLAEQKTICQNLRNTSALIVAENSANFAYICQKPISRFLYINELTQRYHSQQRIIDLIESFRKKQDVLAIWPMEENLTNSHLLENHIYKNGRLLKQYPLIRQNLFLLSKQ